MRAAHCAGSQPSHPSSILTCFKHWNLSHPLCSVEKTYLWANSMKMASKIGMAVDNTEKGCLYGWTWKRGYCKILQWSVFSHNGNFWRTDGKVWGPWVDKSPTNLEGWGKENYSSISWWKLPNSEWLQGNSLACTWIDNLIEEELWSPYPCLRIHQSTYRSPCTSWSA